jgi:hypothetical protein
MFAVAWNRWSYNFVLILIRGFLIELSCNHLGGFKKNSKTFSVLCPSRDQCNITICVVSNLF